MAANVLFNQAELEAHFKNFEIIDDNSLTTSFLHDYVLRFLKHCKQVRRYSNLLASHNGFLLRKLNHIYYHPETNKVVTLIINQHPQLRHHSFILYHLTNIHINQAYPRGDTHYQDFQSFVADFQTTQETSV